MYASRPYGCNAINRTAGLTSRSIRRDDRRAFTLIEMLVSLGVLAIALGVVGIVFGVTTRTVNQAAALSELQATLRQCMLQIEEDLKFIDPSESVLVLVGRTRSAALTDADLAGGRYYRVLTGDPNDVPAGYKPETSPNLDSPGANGYSDYSDPRADIMAFFTKRPAATRAPGPTASPTDPYATGARFSPSFVVYGHAAEGRAERTVNGNEATYQWTDAARHIDQEKNRTGGGVISVLPASEWHVARRSTIVVDPAVEFPNNPRRVDRLQDMDRLLRCEPEANLPGDKSLLSYRWLQGEFSKPGYVLASPYPGSQGMTAPAMPVAAITLAENLLYENAGGKANHHVATILADPPAELVSNLGLHMLPGCAWFQVEFLMPEDARNCLDYVPNDPADSQRTDVPRWVEIEDGATYLFVPDTTYNRALIAQQIDANGVPVGRLKDFSLLDVTPLPAGSPVQDTVDNRRIRLWPYAIRITVRVFDPRGRLEGPVERSVVHRFD